MAQKMGMDIAFGKCLPRQNRWLMKIDDVSGTNEETVDILPPQKSARPQITFKEEAVPHLNETIYFPMKPEFKPIPLTLFDVSTINILHPVWAWITLCYDANSGEWKPSIGNGFKRKAVLELYNGCGEIIEAWVYENAWPQDINFRELDMTSSDIITCDITLRYDRAYIRQFNDFVISS